MWTLAWAPRHQGRAYHKGPEKHIGDLLNFSTWIVEIHLLVFDKSFPCKKKCSFRLIFSNTNLLFSLPNLTQNPQQLPSQSAQEKRQTFSLWPPWLCGLPPWSSPASSHTGFLPPSAFWPAGLLAALPFSLLLLMLCTFPEWYSSVPPALALGLVSLMKSGSPTGSSHGTNCSTCSGYTFAH